MAVRQPVRQARATAVRQGVEQPAAGRRFEDLGWALGVALVAFALYAVTAARGLVTGDTPELIAVAKTFGVAHAPGYPLLTLTGKIFGTLVPVGSFVFRMSLYTAVCSAACAAIVHATIRRLVPSRLAAVTGSLALALTPLYWQWSLQFEVFALSDLLAAALMYLLVRWHLEPTRRGFLLGAALVFGLALTNQQSLVFLVPAIVWLLWNDRRHLLASRRIIGYAAGAIVVGLLPYLYVPIAAAHNPAASWDDVRSLHAFLRLITRADYGNGLTLGTSSDTGGNPILRIGQLGAGIGVVVGLLAVAGLVHAWQRVRWYFWFVGLGVLFTGPAFAVYANIDSGIVTRLFVLQRFFLLPLVVTAPLAGLGVAYLTNLVSRPTHGFSRARAGAVVATVALLATAGIGAASYRTIDLRGDHVADDFARDILSSVPPNGVLFISGDEADAPVLYVHDALHVRPDVTVVRSALVAAPWYDQELRRSNLKVPAKITTLSLLQANPDRPFADIGDLPDNTISGQFYVYGDGLVVDLLPDAVNKSPQQEAQDTAARLATYHVPNWRTIKKVSFESAVLDDYATAPYQVGEAFKQANDETDAKIWFSRAAAMDPHNAKIAAALHAA